MKKLLYDPKIQLEDLTRIDRDLEGRYQRGVAALSRLLPWGLLLFLAITIVEGSTGILSDCAGRAWVDVVGRPPSAVGGQGNLSAWGIIAMARHRLEKSRVTAIFAGDSIFAPPMGGGTMVDYPVAELAANHVPGALNLSQEGNEFAANSLLIRQLSMEPEVLAQKPLLVVDVNLKYYLYYQDLTPPFPLEMELCAEPPDPGDPDIGESCRRLEESWPKGLSAISRASTLLLRGILGQFDFLMSFVIRAPIYEVNSRGWGHRPYRRLLSGILDARTVARHPPDILYATFDGMDNWINTNADYLVTDYNDPNHPKHAWLRSLVRSVSLWPGPALVVVEGFSPTAQVLMKRERIAALAAIQHQIIEQFRATGKRDLRAIPMEEVASDPADYVDRDHFSPRGHAKLAEYVKGFPR
ncbi:MAG: hypothetical protein ACXWP5_06995 [Bdellovibrionota bacterium]